MAGKLTRFYDEHPNSCKEMKLKQVASFAGDGNMLHKATYEDLRDFFSKIDLPMFEKFVNEALSLEKEDKFDDRGFVLQDLVNEMGRRLGYIVTHGLFKGKKGDNGFDGLWKAPDGRFIVMESKTSDAYAIDLKAIVGYREKLISDKLITKNNSSILIVLGRDDKGVLTNFIKGSDEAAYIRAISTQALFGLVKKYGEGKNDSIQHQILNLLFPQDYMLLDNLVDLIFPQNQSLGGSSCGGTFGESGNMNVPDLPDVNLKVGQFVKTAMTNLSNNGFVFTEKQLSEMQTGEWGKCVLKLYPKRPFLKLFDPTNPNGHVVDGYTRYYSEPLVFSGKKYYLTKELFAKTKEPFIEWYKSLAKTDTN